MPSLRDLLDALGQKELQILADALGVQVSERRRKSAFVDAIVQSRRISSANLMEALSVKTLARLCETFHRPSDGRSREELAKALAGPAQDKKVSSSEKEPKKKAVKALAKSSAPSTSSATKTGVAAKPAAKASAAKGSKNPATKAPAERAETTSPGTQSDEVVPAVKAAAKKGDKKTAGAKKAERVDAHEEKSAAPAEAPISQGIAAQPPAAPSAPVPAGKSAHASSTAATKRKKTPPSPARPSSERLKAKDAERGKGASKKGSSQRRAKASTEETEEVTGGTPPRPAISAPLIGVPRARTPSAVERGALDASDPANSHGAEEVPASTKTASAALPEPPQPPAAVRRGLVSWAEAASAAERRGQSAESMLGAAPSEPAHDVHQRCPKCKKRVEMHICQSQQCQNRFVAAAGRRICAECLFERHNLSITDFNARLAEARQCPHCSKPLPERAAG